MDPSPSGGENVEQKSPSDGNAAPPKITGRRIRELKVITYKPVEKTKIPPERLLNLEQCTLI